MFRKCINTIIPKMNLLIILLIFVVSIVGFSMHYSYKFESDYAVDRIIYNDNNATESDIGPIKNDTIIRQEFSLNTEKISDIQLQFLTYERENNGTVTITLYDFETNQPLYTTTIQMKNLKDGEFININMKDSLINVQNEKFVLELSVSNDTANDFITLQTTQGNTMDFSKLFINGVEQNADLKMIMTAKSANLWERYAFIIDAILIATFFSLLYYMFIKDKIFIKKNEMKGNH